MQDTANVENLDTAKTLHKKIRESRLITFNVCEQSSSVPNSYMKTAFTNDHWVTVLLNTESSSYLRKESEAQNLGLNMLHCKKYLYSFVNQLSPVTQNSGLTIVDLQIDEILGNNFHVLVFPDSLNQLIYWSDVRF
ncbi:hypothetical protein NPIL_413961 [Nephila pilipes]|uniref:Uncharacterized protein n=1 Tax=Nephila pilipes TaxID=299642 RepID=A0A8X6UV13_NEPPI|nr:hypothetical protein NPIL_413961 [Nephila pilipes]